MAIALYPYAYNINYFRRYIEPNSNIDWFVVSSRKYWTIKMVR